MLLKEYPKGVQPYIFHGVTITGTNGDDNYMGDCPLCGRADKFGVKTNGEKQALYKCWKCGEGGNATQFLQWLWKVSWDRTKLEDYKKFAANRKLLSVNTLKRWRVAKSVLTGNWLVPGYSAKGNLVQLYQYNRIRNGQYRLMATPKGCGHGHQLFGCNLLKEKHKLICLCEGPWDAMVLWELLRNEPISVLAISGCNSLPKSYLQLQLFAGKQVYLLYDSDHPRKNAGTGKYVEPAGYAALKRTCKRFSEFNAPPEEISYLNWGEGGYDPKQPSGYDIRDYLTTIEGIDSPVERVKEVIPAPSDPSASSRSPLTPLAARLRRWNTLLGATRPVPTEWLSEPSRGSDNGQPERGEGLGCTPCGSYKELTRAWRKALRWTDGLDHALAVMLSCITSTQQIGDQLWIKVIGPAGCGKSTLCEAVTVSQEHVIAKSTIRGFHSGYKTEGRSNSNEDNSLIPSLRDKTLVTKDGDTLLQSPNLSQILSEARDLYDGTSRTHYRNKVSKSYSGIRMTWLLCGTSSLRKIDSSELGERFLDCVIMDKIDDELEDEINWRVANRADNMCSSNGRPSGQYDPKLVKAMQLTGGYVDWLREDTSEKLAEITTPRSSLQKCVQLGKFVAYMRARPSLTQDENAEREFAARLVSQHVRLAKCLALVLNRKRVCPVVMERVRRIAIDTSRGQTLELTRLLYTDPEGIEKKAICYYITSQSRDKTLAMLRFMGQIEVLEPTENKTGYRLTKRMRELYATVLG